MLERFSSTPARSRERGASRLNDFSLAAAIFALGLGLTWLGAGVGVLSGPVFLERVYLLDMPSQRHLLYLQTPGYGGSPLAYWDSDWYYSVATDGYRYDGNPRRQQNIAFFPAYPLLTRLVLAVLPVTWTAAGLAVAWLFAFSFIWVFLALARTVLGGRGAVLATVLAALFPPAVYNYLAYPTSMIVFTAAAALLLWRRGLLVPAALVAGLSTAAGAPGVAAAAAVSLAAAHATWRGRLPALAALGLAGLSVWGIAGFSLFCLWRFSDPFAFASVQQAWQLPADLAGRLGRLVSLLPLRRALESVAHRPVDLVNSVFFLALVGAMASTLVRRRDCRLPRLLRAHGWLALALAAFASAAATGRMGSMGRIIYPAVPAFLALAALIGSRRAGWGLAALSGLGFALFAALFAKGVFVQ